MKPARAAAASGASLPPTRTLVTFTGMGFHSKHWWAKGDGAAMELGPCLKPLESWKERMVVLRGLWNEQANNGIIHCMQTGNMLSGAAMAKNEVHTGVSFDQVMARQIGDRTRLPSLVLGCEEAMPGLQDGHPLLYGSHISWSSPVSPTWTETRPALAFDQLFRTERNRDDRRVVDAVLDDAKSLQRKLSSADRQRFEEYLGSVHEIEGRIKRAGQERERGAQGHVRAPQTKARRQTRGWHKAPDQAGAGGGRQQKAHALGGTQQQQGRWVTDEAAQRTGHRQQDQAACHHPTQPQAVSGQAYGQAQTDSGQLHHGQQKSALHQRHAQLGLQHRQPYPGRVGAQPVVFVLVFLTAPQGLHQRAQRSALTPRPDVRRLGIVAGEVVGGPPVSGRPHRV
jgi:hypothetical protein